MPIRRRKFRNAPAAVAAADVVRRDVLPLLLPLLLPRVAVAVGVRRGVGAPREHAAHARAHGGDGLARLAGHAGQPGLDAAPLREQRRAFPARAQPLGVRRCRRPRRRCVLAERVVGEAERELDRRPAAVARRLSARGSVDVSFVPIV